MEVGSADRRDAASSAGEASTPAGAQETVSIRAYWLTLPWDVPSGLPQNDAGLGSESSGPSASSPPLPELAAAAPATTTLAAPCGREGAAERRDEETADESSLMRIRSLHATGQRDLAEKFGRWSSDAAHVLLHDQGEQYEGLAEKMANDRSAVRYT